MSEQEAIQQQQFREALVDLADAHTKLNQLGAKAGLTPFGNTLAERIESLFHWQHHDLENSLGHLERFTSDLIIWIKSLETVAESVALAETHTEKNARIRGLIEVISITVNKLRQANFDFTSGHYWRAPDAFRADSPTRQFVKQLREKDAEIKRLKIKAGELPPEPRESDSSSEPESELNF